MPKNYPLYFCVKVIAKQHFHRIWNNKIYCYTCRNIYIYTWSVHCFHWHSQFWEFCHITEVVWKLYILDINQEVVYVILQAALLKLVLIFMKYKVVFKFEEKLLVEGLKMFFLSNIKGKLSYSGEYWKVTMLCKLC